MNLERRRAYDVGLQEGRLRYVTDRHSSFPPGARRSGGPARSTNARARPFVQKGQVALKKGDYQTARLNLEIALSHDPDNAWLEGLLDEARSR